METAPKVYRTIFDATTKTGESRHIEYIRYQDGKEHPMEVEEMRIEAARRRPRAGKVPHHGSPNRVSVPAGYVEITKSTADGWSVIKKKDGKTVAEINAKVSPDGKTMAVHQKGVDPIKGQSFDHILVFERQ